MPLHVVGDPSRQAVDPTADGVEPLVDVIEPGVDPVEPVVDPGEAILHPAFEGVEPGERHLVEPRPAAPVGLRATARAVGPRLPHDSGARR